MLKTVLNKSLSLCDIDAEMNRLVRLDESYVTDSARYHLAAGGSRVRAQLGLEAANALALDHHTSMVCAVAPELLHNASLIHDDLQDGDITRRGKPAVWSQFGTAIALATGDFLISTAYLTLARHPRPGMALTAMHNAISLTIHGQMQDSDSAHHSVAQYAEIAANKSGPLLALPVCLALIAADAPGQDIALRAARALAVAYQSLDDLADKSLDKVNGSVNICLLLEASGLTPAEAAASTCSRAYGALKTARREAKSLTRAVGTPFLQLADRLDQQLKDTNNAN